MRYKMHYVNQMAKAIETVCDKGTAAFVLKECETLTAKAPKKQRFIAMKKVMTRLNHVVTPEKVERIREMTACRPAKFKAVVKQIKAETLGEEEMLDKLQRTGFAGFIDWQDGDTAVITFDEGKCYCGMVAHSDGTMPIEWCHCCKGHVRWLYEMVFDKPFDLTLDKSVVAGDAICQFTLNFNRKAVH
ncbi:DUF6144 family protein [Fusibacter sp. JL298sf-3]